MKSPMILGTDINKLNTAKLSMVKHKVSHSLPSMFRAKGVKH